MAKKEIKIEIQDDGGLKIDSRGVPGTADEIRKLLKDMAKAVGGDFREEKHEHGLHTHTHRKVRA